MPEALRLKGERQAFEERESQAQLMLEREKQKEDSALEMKKLMDDMLVKQEKLDNQLLEIELKYKRDAPDFDFGELRSV